MGAATHLKGLHLEVNHPLSTFLFPLSSPPPLCPRPPAPVFQGVLRAKGASKGFGQGQEEDGEGDEQEQQEVGRLKYRRLVNKCG